MPYSLPNFNLVGNIWHGYIPSNGTLPVLPPSTGPDEAIVPMQKYLPRAFSAWWHQSYVQKNDPALISLQIRTLKTTDIRGVASTTGPDVVELPAGSNMFYVCIDVENAHEGFLNEYKASNAYQGWIPTPVPHS